MAALYVYIMKRPAPIGQLTFAEFLPGSFWVVTRGHGIIPDGRRFLVLGDWGNGHWLAWADGIKPRHMGTLLREEHFRREAVGDDD